MIAVWRLENDTWPYKGGACKTATLWRAAPRRCAASCWACRTSASRSAPSRCCCPRSRGAASPWHKDTIRPADCPYARCGLEGVVEQADGPLPHDDGGRARGSQLSAPRHHPVSSSAILHGNYTGPVTSNSAVRALDAAAAAGWPGGVRRVACSWESASAPSLLAACDAGLAAKFMARFIRGRCSY
jgi:hypothetical protein